MIVNVATPALIFTISLSLCSTISFTCLKKIHVDITLVYNNNKIETNAVEHGDCYFID